MQEISTVAEDLLASQEGLCSMELANWLSEISTTIRLYLTLCINLRKPLVTESLSYFTHCKTSPQVYIVYCIVCCILYCIVYCICNTNLNSSKNLVIIPSVNFRVSVRWESSCCTRTDIRTDGHDDANSRFSQLVNKITYNCGLYPLP